MERRAIGGLCIVLVKVIHFKIFVFIPIHSGGDFLFLKKILMSKIKKYAPWCIIFLLVALVSILTMNCCYGVFPFLTVTPHHFPMARETPHIEWLILMRKWLIGTTEYSLKPWPPFGHLFEYSFSFIARFKNVKNNNDYNYK